MEKKQSRKQKATVFVVIMTAFMTTFTGSALNLSIPEIGRQFDAGAQSVGWLVTGYTLAVAAFSVPMGRLADITNRKTVLAAGMTGFTICCIAAVFSVSLPMLLMLRILQGVSASMIFSTNTAILLSAFPEKMRGRVIGHSMAATYTGLSAGPVLGGVLNYHLGWRSVFVLTGILGVISLVFVRKVSDARRERSARAGDLSGVSGNARGYTESLNYVLGKSLEYAGDLKNASEKGPERAGALKPASGTGKMQDCSEKATGGFGAVTRCLDPVGSLLYMGTILFLMYGLSSFRAGAGWWLWMIVGIGILLGILLILWERKADKPVIDVKLFQRNISYGTCNLAAMVNYGATFAVSYLVSLQLQVVMGYSSQTAGLILMVQPIVLAIFSPLAGRLSDRVSPFWLSAAGMAVCGSGIVLLTVSGDGADKTKMLVLIVAALVIIGAGTALFSSPNTNAVMSCVEPGDYGVASSILAAMRSIGNTLGMAAVTAVMGAFAADLPLMKAPPDLLMKIIRIDAVIFAGVCGAGVLLALKRNRR